jgi:RNA polymerase sigma-70 factor (ECF subfamily)
MRSAATDELRDLYEQYGAKIHTLARYLLGSRVAAEDAVQSVFLKAFQHHERFRGEADARTWRWRIAVNHCHDELAVPVFPTSACEESASLRACG